MRLIKAQNTNLRNIYGKGVKYDIDNQVIVDTTNVMLVAKGTTSQRPTSPTNGHLRYNTTLSELEVYSAGAWRSLGYKEPYYAGITVQALGIGDDSTIYFGPLDSQDPNENYTAPAAAANILVFVENVYQIPYTNYDLEENPGIELTIIDVVSTGETTVIEMDGPHGVTAGKEVYVFGVESDPDDNIELLNNDDSTSPGHTNVVSVPSATQLELGVDTTGGNVANYIANTGRLITWQPGTYIKFFEAPPSTGDAGGTVPITAIHNFDK